jgi:hypothetical protein
MKSGDSVGLQILVLVIPNSMFVIDEQFHSILCVLKLNILFLVLLTQIRLFSIVATWMELDLFYQWFDEIFLSWTKTLQRPLILILDGHKTHFMVETLQLAVQNNV